MPKSPILLGFFETGPCCHNSLYRPILSRPVAIWVAIFHGHGGRGHAARPRGIDKAPAARPGPLPENDLSVSAVLDNIFGRHVVPKAPDREVG